MDSQEEFIRQLYDAGLSDEEVAAKVAEANAAEGSHEAPPTEAPSLYSMKTVAPATMAALNKPDPEHSQESMDAFGTQKKQGFTQPFQGSIPGDAGNYTPGAADLTLGAIGDYAGKAFRLAGALIPATRGTTTDAVTGQSRPRTFTEAIQNPQGSLTTPIDESVDKSSLPGAVKTAAHLALGVGQGIGAGVPMAVAGQTVRNLLAKASVPAANVAEGAAKYVQNVRMGTMASDITKGASAGNAMKHGLGDKTLKNALPLAEQKINAWSSARDAIYQKKAAPEISLESVERDVLDNIDSKAFGAAEKNAALQEIRDEVKRFVQNNPKSMVKDNGFTPRRSVSQLTQDEIQAGVNSGEIKYSPKGGKIPFEYAKPEAVPENFLPKSGGVYLNLEQADHLKQWLQDAGANFGKGAPRESKVSEKIFKDVYKGITDRAESYGGTDYAKLNKNLSELIPIRNVIERTLKRGELGSDVVDKMGAIKATTNAAASVTGINRWGATGAYNAAQGIRDEAASSVNLGETAANAAVPNAIRGGLVGALRN